MKLYRVDFSVVIEPKYSEGDPYHDFHWETEVQAIREIQKQQEQAAGGDCPDYEVFITKEEK